MDPKTIIALGLVIIIVAALIVLRIRNKNE